MDSLESLPGEVRRNFTLMYDLDSKNKNILQEVDAASDEYLRKVSELTSDQRRREMENIQKMFKEAKTYGDEKVNIAIQTYEMVDKHIKRMDADLAKFEAELKEKGRLSQTESEEDDEEEEPTKKGGGGGRKKAKTEGGGASSKKKQKVGRPTKGDEKEVKKKQKKGQQSKAASEATTSHQPLIGMPQEIIDMPVDPNEPTYCVCQQVSYGEMIGCDNNDCPIEWFHFGCMQLTTKPKGKWYCPKCIVLFKKKKGGS